MQRASLLQAGFQEDPTPPFISVGFGYWDRGPWHVPDPMASGAGVLLHVACVGAVVPDSRAGSWPGTRM